MPFETPDQLSNDEITILKKESETTEKTDLMKDIFANRGKYIQFNLEKDYYLSRTKNEIAKRYIGGLFDAVIQKYLQEIQQMLGEKPVNTTTATKTDEDLDDRRAGKNVKKISLEKYPDNWLKEPVSLFDYQEYNREKVSTKHQIDIRNLFLSGIDQFELFSDANEFSRITTNVPGTEYAVSARLGTAEHLEKSFTKEDTHQLELAMGKAILASPPFIVTQENRNTPKSKAQFLTLIKNIENTFISTMISITAQKEGRDGPTKKIKTERITEHFNQAQPSDEEFTQYYEGLIHAISHLTNKMMTEKESYKLTYKDGKPQILRYRAETNDIVEIAKNIKYKSKFLSGKEKEFSTNEPNLPFSKNNKRKKETIESSNGEKITYYFSKSHVDLTGLHALLEEDGYDSKLPKYSYNIERVSGNERILLKINPTDDKNGGEYAGMIVQHLDENTGAYREGKYEEYNASERNLTVTNILNQIKGELLDLNLTSDLAS